MKSRRGISEMVSVILILVVVSIIGAALYRTTLVTLGSQYTTYAQQANDQTLAAQERFEVVNVQKVDPSNILVYLLNYSPDNTIDISVSTVYLDESPATWHAATITSNPGLLEKNIVTPIKITGAIGTTFNNGYLYKILIVSQRGTVNAYTWKCP
jgi:hypothetical protein